MGEEGAWRIKIPKNIKQEPMPQIRNTAKETKNAFVGIQLQLMFTEKISELLHVLVETSKANNKTGKGREYLTPEKL